MVKKYSSIGTMEVDTQGFAHAQWAVGQYETELPFFMNKACLSAAQAMKKALQKSYEQATRSSKPNTWATILNKNLKPEFWGGSSFQTLASKGYINAKTLVETGSLAQAVEDTDVFVSSSKGSVSAVVAMSLPRAGSDCHFSHQTRRDTDHVYAWDHEFGAGPAKDMYKFGVMAWGNDWSIPKRPWIERGTRNGLTVARTTMVNAAASAQANFSSRANYRGGRGVLDFNLGSLAWDIISIMMPPTNLYAYWGAANDYLSMMSGSFTMSSFASWIGRYAMGSTGVSRNVYRRKLRNALYH
jgi:hypothetical protein